MAQETLYRRIDCPRCQGRGQVVPSHDPYSQAEPVSYPCPDCCGTGVGYEEAGHFETGDARGEK